MEEGQIASVLVNGNGVLTSIPDNGDDGKGPKRNTSQTFFCQSAIDPVISVKPLTWLLTPHAPPVSSAICEQFLQFFSSKVPISMALIRASAHDPSAFAPSSVLFNSFEPVTRSAIHEIVLCL